MSRVFRLLDYQVQVIRPWDLKVGSILFVSDHDLALDGFAIALACPNALTVRQVVFHLSALVVGREFMADWLETRYRRRNWSEFD